MLPSARTRTSSSTRPSRPACRRIRSSEKVGPDVRRPDRRDRSRREGGSDGRRRERPSGSGSARASGSPSARGPGVAVSRGAGAGVCSTTTIGTDAGSGVGVGVGESTGTGVAVVGRSAPDGDHPRQLRSELVPDDESENDGVDAEEEEEEDDEPGAPGAREPAGRPGAGGGEPGTAGRPPEPMPASEDGCDAMTVGVSATAGVPPRQEHLAQRRGEGAAALVPPLRLLRQDPVEDRVHVRREIGPERRRRRRRRATRSASSRGRAPRSAPRGAGPSASGRRGPRARTGRTRGVSDSPLDCSGERYIGVPISVPAAVRPEESAMLLARPKSPEDDPAALVEEDVHRLDVAVDDAPHVGRVEGRGEVVDPLADGLRRGRRSRDRAARRASLPER